nr:adenylate/guanylate cyclase domain-containing protein [Sedimentitalea sp. CY04]
MKAGLGSFGAYVPKELVRSIISKGEKVAVGGQSREVTIMFSDLQGFTTRTENLEPEALMPALSEYFETMEKQVTAHSGIVDKYIGDAVMALWNAQKADDKHCENACQAVLACQRAEAEINASNLSSPLVPLHTRFGLHCGTVIVGNVGSLSRMQYTALGSSVNLASRVEGLGKVYGTRALVTEPVVLHTEGLFCVREVDIVSPAGTTKPIRIYELLGEEDDRGTYPASPEMKREVEDWNTCYALYRLESWTEALAAFEDHLGSSSSPMLVDTYIQRCRNFIAHPPDEEWDGVYCFKTK